jgi:hypothetical protein
MQAAAKSVRVFIVVQTFKQEQVFLKEKVSATNVKPIVHFGSKADIRATKSHVRFTPESGR